MNKRQRIAILTGIVALVVYSALFVPQHRFKRTGGRPLGLGSDLPVDVVYVLTDTRRGFLFGNDSSPMFSSLDYYKLATERLLVEWGFIILLTLGAVLALSDKKAGRASGESPGDERDEDLDGEDD
jgi:hypothetical protein